MNCHLRARSEKDHFKKNEETIKNRKITPLNSEKKKKCSRLTRKGIIFIKIKIKKRKLNSLNSEKKWSRLTRESVWAEDKREKFHSAD